jgi:hypothetical protein
MKSRVAKVLVCHSSEPYYKNGQHHPIRNQWGIVEAETPMKFRHGERSIPGSRPSTIRLMGIPCQMEEMGEMEGRHGEGSSSFHRT